MQPRTLNRFQQLNAVKISGVPTQGLDAGLKVLEDAAAKIPPAGYRDPRGLPVWKSSRAVEVRVAELSGDGRLAKVIATVATSYSDRDEESIEDDIIYLARVGDRWLVAKPSATLYRAVGVADVPPSVLSPPR